MSWGTIIKPLHKTAYIGLHACSYSQPAHIRVVCRELLFCLPMVEFKARERMLTARSSVIVMQLHRDCSTHVYWCTYKSSFNSIVFRNIIRSAEWIQRNIAILQKLFCFQTQTNSNSYIDLFLWKSGQYSLICFMKVYTLHHCVIFSVAYTSMQRLMSTVHIKKNCMHGEAVGIQFNSVYCISFTDFETQPLRWANSAATKHLMRTANYNH